jgi:hypothetical protein
MVSLPTETKKFAFIEKAQAQSGSVRDEYTDEEITGGGNNQAVPGATTDDGQGTEGRSYDETSNWLGNGPTKTTDSNSTQKKSNNGWLQFGLDLFNVNSRQQQAAQTQGQFACNRQPGLNYGSPFTGTPVAGMLGYSSNNIIPGFNGSNWQPQMQALASFAAQSQPCISQVLPYFNGGLNAAEYNRMAAFFDQGCLPSMPATNQYYMSPVTNMMRNLCSAILLSGNQQLVQQCQQVWRQVEQTGQVLSGSGNMSGGLSSLNPSLNLNLSQLTPINPSQQPSSLQPINPSTSTSSAVDKTARAELLVKDIKTLVTNAEIYASRTNGYDDACASILSAEAKLKELNTLYGSQGTDANNSYVSARVNAYCYKTGA